MAFFEIKFKRSAEKDLRHLDRQFVPQVVARIEALVNDPFPRQSIKLSSTEGLCRVRVSAHRIIYGVDVESREVLIHYVRHRSDVYRTLSRPNVTYERPASPGNGQKTWVRSKKGMEPGPFGRRR